MRGRHKSLDKELKRTIQWVETLPGVTKIVIGISEACRHRYAPGTLKVKSIVDGGLKVNGYSGKGVTDLFLRIDPVAYTEAVKAAIEARFQG